MKTDTERKLDELLARMPKRDYDLDAWLNEDETAEFDRLQRTNTDLYLQRTNTDLYSQQTNTDLHGSKRKAWRWVAAAACLLIIIGIGVTTELMHQKPEDMPAIIAAGMARKGCPDKTTIAAIVAPNVKQPSVDKSQTLSVV